MQSATRFLFPVVLVSARALQGHEGEPLQPHDLWYAWSADPFVIAIMVLSALLFGLGARQKQGILRWEMTCYWLGWSLLLIALISPLHAAGEALFSAHMAQHELMMVGAAPLLVLGRPLISYLWALPQGERRTVGKWFQQGWIRGLWSFLSDPFHAWWLHFIVLWGWHAPILFGATLSNDVIHSAQHLSFFLSALLFWWALIRRHGRRKEYGAGAFYIFTTMIHTGLLGVLLTFSTSIWYTAYSETTQAWGLTPLEDQQLGGLIMIVPPIAVYLAAFLILFWIWVRDSDQSYRDSFHAIPKVDE
ncbi:MAG TPA: cytochrome c oxidase assembly protein [Bryobacteraceae bacterium]|nr:cytochrome c oxidase assembly protein [Bryobacteraceae bacterium]